MVTQVTIPQDQPHSRAVELLETGAEGLSTNTWLPKHSEEISTSKRVGNVGHSPSLMISNIIQIQMSNQFRDDSIPVVCRYSYSHTYPKLTKSGRLALRFPTHPNPGLSQPTWTMICRHLAEKLRSCGNGETWRNHVTNIRPGLVIAGVEAHINGVSKAWIHISQLIWSFGGGILPSCPTSNHHLLCTAVTFEW